MTTKVAITDEPPYCLMKLSTFTREHKIVLLLWHILFSLVFERQLSRSFTILSLFATEKKYKED